MIRLDTLRLQVPTDTIKNIDFGKFTEDTKKDNETQEVIKRIEKIKDKYKPIGLSEFTFNENYFTLTMSAKVLKKSYYELITKNTIEEVFNNVNQSKALELDINTAIDRAEVLRCDVTNNLKVSKSVDSYLKLLYNYKLNRNYLVSKYHQHGGSVIFKRDVKTYKERMIFYNKEFEILRDKQLIKFFTSKEFRQFENDLRCEQNITSFKNIREQFKIGTHNLKDVLNSTAKPNLRVYDRITDKKLEALLLFEEYDNKKIRFQDIVKMEGMKGIIKKFNYNEKLIREFIRHYYKGQPSHWNKKFSNMIRKLQSERETNKKEIASIQEIRRLLEVA